MLERLLPFNEFATSPFFQYPVRRVRWGGSLTSIRRYTWIVFVGALALIGAFWLLAITSRLHFCTGVQFSCWQVYDVGSSVIALLALASIGADVMLDIAAMHAAQRSMNQEHTGTHWDLIRLTPQRDAMIIEVKHGLALVRAWRIAVLVLALRVAVVALLLVQGFVLPPLLNEPVTFFSSVSQGLQYDAVLTLSILIAAALFCVIFVVEPLWRVTAVTALGLAVVVRFRQIISTVLAAMFAVLALWIVQISILALLIFLTSRLGYGLSTLVGVVAGAVVVAGFYRVLRQRALEHAEQRLFAD